MDRTALTQPDARRYAWRAGVGIFAPQEGYMFSGGKISSFIPGGKRILLPQTEEVLELLKPWMRTQLRINAQLHQEIESIKRILATQVMSSTEKN